MLKDRLLDFYREHRMFILYAVNGIPPTIVGFLGYLLFTYWLGTPAFVANGIAWVIGVVMSFFLYRKFVFHSTITGIKGIFLEGVQFTMLRVISGLFETGLVFVFVDMLHWHKLIFKVVASFCAAMLNYFVSKIVIFRKKKQIQKMVK